MWLLRYLSLFLLAFSLSCPRIFCGNPRPPFCLTWSREYLEAVLHPCLDPSEKCLSSDFPTQTDLKCTAFNPFELDFWSPYYGTVGRWGDYAWQPKGSNCGVNQNLCEPSLRCELGVCVDRKDAGESCVQGECTLGLTCDWGVCVDIGRVEVGNRVTSEAACIYYSVDGEGRCVEPPKSTSILPVPCTHDSNCTASDGTPGSCNCAYNLYGAAYCALHTGDPPYQLFLRAQAQMDVRQLPYRYYWARYYPMLVRPNECSGESLPEVFAYLQYSGSGGVGWATVGVLIVVYI